MYPVLVQLIVPCAGNTLTLHCLGCHLILPKLDQDSPDCRSIARPPQSVDSIKLSKTPTDRKCKSFWIFLFQKLKI